jgi:hypothetical protein
MDGGEVESERERRNNKKSQTRLYSTHTSSSVVALSKTAQKINNKIRFNERKKHPRGTE